MSPRRAAVAGCLRRLGICASICLAGAAAAPPAAGQVAVRGFVQAGLLRFAAAESFTAITGRPGAAVYGGGGQIGVAGLFVQGSIERYAATGRRVFVFEDRVFDLGIPNQITIVPVQVTAGYRMTPRGRWRLAGYGGGGLGAYRFAESAPFGPRAGDPPEASAETVVPPLGPPYGDEVRETHRSYHVLGGVEAPLLPWLRLGGEGQWTWVPGALGEGGAPAAFGESDLGGLTLRVKLSMGY